ncbi:hypothetical protein B0T16DRAFT_459448 [Cercophora newfieldiana]|uniref:Uncharacterized protein n=1 Tax=Cercophora newfieldiana TaxID=92897 RepID=A0AA40CLX8_9PEZI|nr:hypothetical protein B0T16DRAFT_459448 [Cercophora newfieldiana]
MRFRPFAILLGGLTSTACASTAASPQDQELEARGGSTNASIDTQTQKGFEVVIVYATPDAGCPANPTECKAPPAGPPSPLSTGKQKPPSPVVSPGKNNSPGKKPDSTWDHTGPLDTLMPAVHWNCDTMPATNVIPIKPGTGSNMYYGVSDPSKAGYFAFLTHFFTKPSVNLDHCHHVKTVEYSGGGGGGLVIAFRSREAYNHAVKTWVLEDELILIAFVAGCGDHAKGERCFFRVRAADLVFKDGELVVIAGGKSCRPEDVTSGGETEWGWWKPPKPRPPPPVGGPGTTSCETETASGTPTGPSRSFSYSVTASPSVSFSSASSSAFSSASSSAFSSASSSAFSSASSSAFSSGSSSVDPSGPSASASSSSAFSSAFSSEFSSVSPSASSSALPPTESSAVIEEPEPTCIPPADTKYGLPTACLGPDFDYDLDEHHGWTDLPQEYVEFIQTLAPEIHDDGVPSDGSEYDDYDWLRRRALVRTPNPNSNGTHRSTLRRRATCVLPFLCIDGNTVRAAGKVVDDIKKAGRIEGSINTDIKFEIPNLVDPNSPANRIKDLSAKQIESPWGRSVLLKAFGTPEDQRLGAHLNIFCVDCGVTGSAKLAGKVKWSTFEGFKFTEGHIKVTVDAKLALKLGVDAQIKLEQTFQTSLFDLGLPGLSWGVATIGPMVSVGAKVTLEAAANGRLLVGAEMGLQSAEVNFDVVDHSKTRSQNWTPYFTPVLQAEGELMLSASLGLPIGLKCGIKIASFDKSLGIIDEPSIKGVAQIAASIGLENGTTFKGGLSSANGCQGISCQVSWQNRVYVNVFDLAEISLFDTKDQPIAQKCIQIGASSAASERQQAKRYPALDGRQASDTTTTSSVASSPSSSSASTGPTSTATTKIIDVTNKIKSGNASSIVSYEIGSIPYRPYNDSAGFEYSMLVSSSHGSSTGMLVSCSNGNVYGAEFDESAENTGCSELWMSRGGDDILVADGAQRLLHYDKDAMTATGVSRLRSEDETDLPVGAAIVALVRSDLGSDVADPDYFYAAVDPDGNIFYLVLCNYDDETKGSRLFLANHPDNGIETLLSSDLKYSVTGGNVTECGPFLLQAAVFDEEDDYVGYDGGDENWEEWELEEGWWEEE